MHNMIVADQGYNVSVEVPTPRIAISPDEVDEDEDLELRRNETNLGFIARRLAQLEDKDEHYLLRQDLTEHLWHWAGDQKS